ncbi:YbaN family protein [Pseudidiomarina taiwanensis]|uniref:Inner membrane protein n=1 Tax=Pseudidiomarina taiwanensis TaxID=337250 RepID=A0A432ZFG8_9GAMM|nr:YbaN family protein [Pseudidiomarina taiwanensis]RUO76649.1 DUF454 domain-containing protein [Pseudidiomarina taiwanensis]
MTELLRMIIWRSVAITFVLLGLVGLALPVMPTVPFLLVAAWAGGKGWPKLEAKLLAHPKYGPPIIEWRRYGVVRRNVKIVTTLMMSGGATIMMFLDTIPLWLKFTILAIMVTVATWLWLRPEHIPED